MLFHLQINRNYPRVPKDCHSEISGDSGSLEIAKKGAKNNTEFLSFDKRGRGQGTKWLRATMWM